MNREVCGICWCPYDDNGACGCEPQTGATMKRDDIIRMAREAGATKVDAADPQCWVGAIAFDVDELKRFAALVAAAERDACAALLEANGMRCGEESLSRLILETNAAAIRARNP